MPRFTALGDSPPPSPFGPPPPSSPAPAPAMPGAPRFTAVGNQTPGMPRFTPPGDRSSLAWNTSTLAPRMLGTTPGSGSNLTDLAPKDQGPTLAERLKTPFAVAGSAAGVGKLASSFSPSSQPMNVAPEQMEGAMDIPTVKEANPIVPGLDVIGGVAGLGSGAIRLAEGDKVGGAIQTAGGAVSTANALGADIPYVGPALSLASIGEGAARGGQAGERAAVEGAMNLAAAAIPGFGTVFGIGKIAESLINLGLNEYTQGDLSKAIMKAKQTSFAQYGNQAQEEALKAAPDFHAALRGLSVAPSGTSGQVQWGVGKEYAGETLVDQAGTTQTPGWANIIRGISDPATLRDHPDLVANFIDKLWVQTGPSGAAAFNPGATRDYQVHLLSKLPNTPEWLAAKQKILNSEPTDPRARDPKATGAPDLPVEPGFLHVNGLRIPTDHQYQSYDGASGKSYDASPERVAQTLGPWSGSNLLDKTTGKWLGPSDDPTVAGRGPTNPAYLDPQTMATPWFKAKAKAMYDDQTLRVPDPESLRFGAYNPIDMNAYGRLGQFLGIAAPPASPPPLSNADYWARQGGGE